MATATKNTQKEAKLLSEPFWVHIDSGTSQVSPETSETMAETANHEVDPDP